MKKLESHLTEFVPISLEHLNATMELLERIDDKYLIDAKQINKILTKMKKYYSILNIKWKSIFVYDNVHFDTADLDSYKMHLSNITRRWKARSRMYVDSKLSFFECKIKNSKVTSKYRFQIEPEKHWVIDKESELFLSEIVKTNIKKTLKSDIAPKVITRYKRMTFCWLETQERVTVDVDLEFCVFGKDERIKLPNLIIVENKYQKDKSVFDKIAKELNLKTVSSCSKYCFGLIYTWLTSEYSKFKKTIKRIENISKIGFLSKSKTDSEKFKIEVTKSWKKSKQTNKTVKKNIDTKAENNNTKTATNKSTKTIKPLAEVKLVTKKS